MSTLYSEENEDDNPFRSSPPPPPQRDEQSDKHDDDVPPVEDVQINRSPSHDEHSEQEVSGQNYSDTNAVMPSTSSPTPYVKRTEFGYVMLTDRKEKMNEIQIVDAVKTHEGSTSSYIAYVIRSPFGETRHRYSEFEGLRTVLSKMYPCYIIAPIPPHHSIGDYAVKQSKAKEDANVIARRKRMLNVFLSRLACHPILGQEQVFLRFLQPNISWAEILHSAPVTQLSKNILRAPAENPHEVPLELAPIYNNLPLPSSSQPLLHPDQRFLDSESFTNAFAAHLSGSTERINRRLMKRWSDLSSDWADLGAAMNGFSLQEEHQHSLSVGIEKVGQAVDGNYVNTNAMLQVWERVFTEPLSEYGQFSGIIKQLLKYRHNKHAQFEMVREVLDAKRAVLIDMERTEAEAQRLEQALDRAASRVKSLNLDGEVDSEASSVRDAVTDDGSRIQQQNQHNEHEHVRSPLAPSSSSPTSPTAIASRQPAGRSVSRSGGRNGGYGLFDAISHKFQGVMDVDPESARRSSITKTREAIEQLHLAVQATHKDVRFASQTIQADLDRFQRQKVGDIKDMTLAFARLHQQWCKKNVEAWEEAKQEAAKIAEQV